MASYIEEVYKKLETLEIAIESDLAISEQSISQEEKLQLIAEVKNDLSPVKRRRAVIKRKVSLLLKTAVEVAKGETLSLSIVSLLEEVSMRLDEIRQLDTDLEALICRSTLIRHDSTVLDEEVVGATQYHLEVQKIINRIRPPTPPSSPRSETSASSHGESVSRAELKSILKNFRPQQELSLPKLKCHNFSGGKEDRFSFRSFLVSFDNVYSCRRDISEAAKLQYLKSHLSDFALRDIEHLSNVNENLQVALDILRSQYLDEPYVVDSLLHRIDEAPVLLGNKLEDIRSFIAEIRSHLHELKVLGWNFFEDETAGCKLISHIIVDKLPSAFLKELKLITQEEYPSVNLIFLHSNKILKSLEKFREKGFSGKGEPSQSFIHSSPRKKPFNFPSSSGVLDPNTTGFKLGGKTSPESGESESESESESSHSSFTPLEHYVGPKMSKAEAGGESTSESQTSRKSVSSPTTPLCKLCEERHFMTSCQVYTSPILRRERCLSLGLCDRCSSRKHVSTECPAERYGLSRQCRACKSRVHITALCSVDKKSGAKFHSPGNCRSSSSSCRDSEEDSGEDEDEGQVFDNLCIESGNTSNCSSHLQVTPKRS